MFKNLSSHPSFHQKELAQTELSVVVNTLWGILSAIFVAQVEDNRCWMEGSLLLYGGGRGEMIREGQWKGFVIWVL